MLTVEEMKPLDTNSVFIKLIKTIKIYDEKTLQIKRSILVDDIDMREGSMAHSIQRADVLQDGSNIYFYRKVNELYRLYSYSFQNDIVKAQDKKYDLRPKGG